MVEFLHKNIISIAALLVSFLSFLISFSNHMKSKIKLKIISYNEDNLCFSFIWYKQYRVLIADLVIENNSTSDVTISKIKLLDNSKTFYADLFNISDCYNDDGLTLLDEDDDSIQMHLNLISENILNNKRIGSYDSIKGYAVFYDVDLIEEPKDYKIVVETPAKSFYSKITVTPLPSHLHPIYPSTN